MPLVLIRGGGDLASGTAIRLHRAGFKVVIAELSKPLAVRRAVSFAEAVYEGEWTVEDVTARRVDSLEQAFALAAGGVVPVLVAPAISSFLHPAFCALVDARLVKLPPELSPVMAAVTTHLGDWQVSLAERHFVWADGEPMPEIRPAMEAGTTLVTGRPDPGANRFGGLSERQVCRLRELASGCNVPLLIEADGSRQRSLKAPAEHEPAIPSGTGLVLAVAGLGALGKPLDREHVHRPERRGGEAVP